MLFFYVARAAHAGASWPQLCSSPWHTAASHISLAGSRLADPVKGQEKPCLLLLVVVLVLLGIAVLGSETQVSLASLIYTLSAAGD